MEQNIKDPLVFSIVLQKCACEQIMVYGVLFEDRVIRVKV